MGNPKSNQKCVRLTDEVLAIVEKTIGDGFNQKFENLVYEYAHQEKELKRRITALEAEERRLKKGNEDLRNKAQSYLIDINRYLELAAKSANAAMK